MSQFDSSCLTSQGTSSMVQKNSVWEIVGSIEESVTYAGIQNIGWGVVLKEG